MEMFLVPFERECEVWMRAEDGTLSFVHSFASTTQAEAFADYRRSLLARDLEVPVVPAGRKPWLRLQERPDMMSHEGLGDGVSR